MKIALRSLVAAAAVVGGLVLAAPAMAAYTTPRFEVDNANERVSSGGPVTLSVRVSKDDDSTFRIVFYIPQGYQFDFGRPAGTRYGTVNAQINARAISPDAIVPVTGSLDAVDPAPYQANPQSIGCAGGSSFNVMLMTLTAAGQSLAVPMYALTPTGQEASFSAGKLIACLPPPETAQLGAKLIQASLTFTGVFTNPVAGGSYRWRALWTPYVPGTGTPNPAGSVETQSVDALPAQLTLRSLGYNTRTRILTLTGTLTEGTTRVANAPIRLFFGRTNTGTNRPAGRARTNGRGVYTARIRFIGKGVFFFRARADVPTRTANCPQTFAPVPCIASNRGHFAIRSVPPVRVKF